MDIKDSYLHGTVGVVKSIDVDADKIKYTLADILGTVREVTMPLATTSANGLMSSADKKKLDAFDSGSLKNNLVLKINSGTTEGTSLYTYNGSDAKTLDIKSGSGINLTSETNSVTIKNSGQKQSTYVNNIGEVDTYKKVTVTKFDTDGYGIWIHSRQLHYLLNSGAPTMTSPMNTFWELGTNYNGGSTTRTISVKTVATASSATVTLYILARAFTYFLIVSSGTITITDSTQTEFEGITDETTGWIACKPAKWTDTTYNVVSNLANGLAPKVINTNTGTIGNTYYLLASSNGSAAPSWYKLPTTAFSNDDTKVTQTNTTSNEIYRILFSSTADDTTRTEGARKSANLKFNPSTGNLTTTSLNLNGDIVINDGTNKDRYIKWQYNNTDQYGWRIGYLGDNNAHGNDNNALVFDSCQGTKGWATALKFDQTTMNAVFSKNVTANTFIGNIDGQYVNALTNYIKADAIGAIGTNDSLNSALGKLEFKTDFIYNDIIGGENNANVIDKWSEIKDFIAEVGNSTDITDVFVTRKTALTVTGLKTFIDNVIINTTAPNKTPKLTLKEHYTGSSSWISEIVSDYYGRNVCTTENFTNGLYIILGRELFNNLNILDSTKTPIARISKEKGHWFDGTLTVSGTIFTTNTKTSWLGGMTKAAIMYHNYTAIDNSGYHPILGVKTNSENVVNLGAYIDSIGFYGYKKGRTENSYDWSFVFNSETGAVTHSGTSITAKKFVTSAGTSTLFVKGDGSLDSNTYALSSSLGNYVTLTTTQTISGSKTFTSTLTTRSITPLSNNTYSLGTSDKKWASLYSTNIYSNAIYNGTTIYASNNEIIHADSSYFELNKGYPNAIMWMNASEYKFKLGSKGVQFMIAANGNVGIGDVGGAPAYKLHIGGGDLMADTVHAWSGGFKKNGSSDSYVLLGGGGHKLMSTFFTSLTSDSTNAISITICGTTKSISKSTLASSLGSLKNPYALTVFGVSYDGSAVKTVDMSTLIGVLGTGDSPITDSTHLLTSHVSGFTSSGNTTTIYKRTATHLWSYIKSKTDGEYVTALGTNGNYVTWTKNGTDHDLTVPYASSSGKLLFKDTTNTKGLTCYYAGLSGSDDKTGAFVGPIAGTTTYSSILRLQSHTTAGELYYRDLIFDVNSDRIWSRRVTNSGNPVLREIPMIRKVEFTPTPTDEGWYRFASFSSNSSRVSNCIFSILRSYYSPENEHYIFSVSIGFNGHISITLLSGYIGGHLIPKIRVVYTNSSTCYLDFYMTSTNNELYKNVYAVEIYSGDGTIQTPTLTTTVGGTVYEFTTVNGCKSDRGFTGNLSGAATTLAAVSVISNKKFTSLTNASWTDTGYTFTELESGTYAVLVTSTNLVASGIMSVYKNITDSVGDEIPLHVYGTAGWRPYLRTSANKLLISSNDVKAATNGRTVTIKIARII